MRALILIAGAALVMAGCGNNDQKDNTQNIDENLTAENIVSNDVTAIDAVTAADANMAANVNYIDVPANAAGNLALNSASGSTAKTSNRSSNSASKPSSSKPATPSPEPAAPTTNATE